MKIAVVSDAIYPYNKGGKEKRIYELTKRLAAKGYDVHVYTMKWWKGNNHIVKEGVHLHAICAYYPLYSGDRRSIRQGIMFGLSCLKLITQKWDVIDVDHMPYFPLYFTKIICMFKGKKMIATWHEVWGRDYWMKYLGGWKGLIAWWIEKFSIDMPDQIIADMYETVKRLRNNLHYSEPITTIPVGIDLEHIDSVEPSVHQYDILFSGRLLKHKNVDILIEAVALLAKDNPQVTCCIVGNGPEEEPATKLVQKLGLGKNITLIPFVEDHKMLIGLMKSAGVFVLPSSREGFGIVALEANACGKQVITVDQPDNLAVYLKQGDNVIVTPFGAGGIAAAIKQVFAEKRTFSREFLEQYSWDNIVKKTEEVYKK